jgi:hypothetical protein
MARRVARRRRNVVFSRGQRQGWFTARFLRAPPQRVAGSLLSGPRPPRLRAGDAPHAWLVAKCSPSQQLRRRTSAISQSSRRLPHFFQLTRTMRGHISRATSVVSPPARQAYRRAQMATKRKTAKKPAKKAAGKVAKRTPKRKTAKRAKKAAKKAPGKAKGKKKPTRGPRKAARKPAASRARRPASAAAPKVEPPKDVPPMLGGVAPSKIGLDEGEEE